MVKLFFIAIPHHRPFLRLAPKKIIKRWSINWIGLCGLIPLYAGNPERGNGKNDR